MNAFDIISAIVAHSDTKTRLVLAVVALKWQQVVEHTSYGSTHVCFHNFKHETISLKVLGSACRHYQATRSPQEMKAMLLREILWQMTYNKNYYHRLKPLFYMIYDKDDIRDNHKLIYLWAAMIEGFDKQHFPTLRGTILYVYEDEYEHRHYYEPLFTDVVCALRKKQQVLEKMGFFKHLDYDTKKMFCTLLSVPLKSHLLYGKCVS